MGLKKNHSSQLMSQKIFIKTFGCQYICFLNCCSTYFILSVFKVFNLSNIKMKKQDKIRVQNSGKYFENRDETQELFEFKLIELFKEMLECIHLTNKY